MATPAPPAQTDNAAATKNAHADWDADWDAEDDASGDVANADDKAEDDAPRFAFAAAFLRYAPPWIAALVAGYLAMNYVLNAFYVQGQLVADAGWFAGMVWHNDWQMNHPVAVRDFIRLYSDDFYGIHASPLLVGAAYLSYLAPLEAPEWFSLFMAGGAALMAFCFAHAAGDFLRFHCPRLFGGDYLRAFCVIAAGVVFALNPITANILVYPHFEIYIPAFLLLFLLCLARDRRKTALLAFVLLLCTRGDAGFHLAAILWAAAGFLSLADWRGRGLYAALVRHRRLLWWSAPAFIVSIVLTVFFGREVPFSVFDNPPDINEIVSRLRAIVWRLEYTPLFVFIPVAALVCRRLDWMIGLLAVVPWIALSLFSYAYGARLEAYYAFPLIFALFWPLVSHRFALSQKHAPYSPAAKKIKRPRAKLAALFLLLFAAITFIRPLEVQSTIRSALKPFLQSSLLPPPPERVAAVRQLGEFYRQNRRRIISDDTFASLYPHDVPAVKELGLNNDRILACGGDMMIINRAHFNLLSDMLYTAAYHFRLRHWYGLANTDYLLASAAPMCENGVCQNNLPLAELDLSGWQNFAADRAHDLTMIWDGCTLGAWAEDPIAAVAALPGNRDDKTLLVDKGEPDSVAAMLFTPPLRGRRFFDVYYSYVGGDDGVNILLEVLGGTSPLQIALPPRPPDAQGGARIAFDPGENETALTVIVRYPGKGSLRLHQIQMLPEQPGG
ncbi:MAG: hypothetical protein ACR2P4_06025 [Gammaproteobacteria bacterium]